MKKQKSNTGAIYSFLLMSILAIVISASYADAAQQLQVSWVDNSDNETGFLLERGNDPAGPFVEVAKTGVDQVTFLDAAVASLTQYCYRVLAFNAIGNSAYSNVACKTTLGLPNAPGGVTIEIKITIP